MLGCMLPKMGLSLYISVYNILKVMIYPGSQPYQFAFSKSIHRSPFQQIFLKGLGNVLWITQRLDICAKF